MPPHLGLNTKPSKKPPQSRQQVFVLFVILTELYSLRICSEIPYLLCLISALCWFLAEHTMKMEVTCSSEMSIVFQQAT
jgi:hypothetical protein